MDIKIINVLQRWPNKKLMMTVPKSPSSSPFTFVTLAIKYEKRNTNSFVICGMLSVYPYLVRTWQVDNTPIPEGNMEGIGSFDPFYNKGRVNIIGSNLLYACTIENPLLKQTWTGRWTMKSGLHGAFCVYVLCQRVGGMGNDLQDRTEHKGKKMHL